MISIIIPAYNSEKFIQHCILSVVNQTYRDLEIIIVDNNSTDSTAEIIKKAELTDSRIKYVFCTVAGVSNARNAGLFAATGDYVFFLDSDDTLDLSTMEILYNAAIKDDLDIAAPNILYSSETGKSPMEKNHKSIIAKGGEIPEMFSNMLTSYVWYMVFKLFKRSKLNEVFFSDKLLVGEDLDFVIRALGNSDAVCFIDTPLYIYNISQDGLNLKYNKKLYELKTILYNSVKEYLIRNNKPLDNLYINLVNDVFALAVNEQKSDNPNFDRLFTHALTAELLKCNIFSRLGISKKIFYVCLKYKIKFALVLLAKIWIKK